MRAPSISVRASERGKPVRDGSIHYHGSNKAEESENVYYSPANYEIQATQQRGEYQPRLRISQPKHLPGCASDCNIAHPLAFLHMDCPDTMALGALAEIDISHEPEELDIGVNAGDDCNAAWVRTELASGNEWAWCRVTVRARWAGFEGRDHLGCCSYRNRNDFLRPGGYCDDMIREALEDLARNIQSGAEMLKRQGDAARTLLARGE